jgi:hypothetical protein
MPVYNANLCRTGKGRRVLCAEPNDTARPGSQAVETALELTPWQPIAPIIEVLSNNTQNTRFAQEEY